MYQSFIITLFDVPASCASAQQLKLDLENIGITAELFEGTPGSDAAKIIREQKREVHGYLEPSTNRYYQKQLRPGVQGCFFSHYRLWQHCAELDQPITIFEDDVLITRPLIPVEFTDVLIICLGAIKRACYEEFLAAPVGVAQAVPYIYNTMPGACGYIIKPKAAAKLVKTYKNTFLAADSAISSELVDISIHNHLVGQANTQKTSLTKSSEFWLEFSLGRG
jgi:GR25 family glycosyltransferase involved in LPS biosynthesis